MRKLAALRNRSPFAGDQPLDSISLCVYGDSTGLRYWNGNNDLMPINIVGGKTLEECIFYQGGGITVYTDNIVKVRTYEGFYDYFLANQRQMSEIMMLPTEEVLKDKEYYDKLVNGLALQYNQQIENAPNFLRNAQVLQDVNTPVPINFACTVFNDVIWIGEGYSVGTADKPPCPVDVPSGKLSFATKATSETHSFILKNIEFEKIRDAGNWVMENGELLWVSITESNLNTPYNLYYSKNYKSKDEIIARVNTNAPIGTLSLTNAKGANTMFNSKLSQLLFYKDDLTETELKGELAKDIKLK